MMTGGPMGLRPIRAGGSDPGTPAGDPQWVPVRGKAQPFLMLRV